MPRICSPLRQTGDHVLVILDVLGGVRDIHQSLCACKVARAPMSLWIQYLQRGSQRAPSSRGSIPCRVVPFHGVAGPLGRIRRQPRILTLWPISSVPVVTRALTMPLVTRHPRVVRP